MERIRRRVGDLVATDRPVLAGPFTGEVGFELLYWIPLLRWAVAEHPELERDLVVVSRGGTHHWLSGLAARYVDLLEVVSPDELRAGRPSLKQPDLSDFDQEIVKRVRRRLGLSKVALLHPSSLFDLYIHARRTDPFAFARAIDGTSLPVRGLAARYARLPAPDRGPLEGLLPDDYVAVRFYFRPSFPEHEANLRFAAGVIRQLARRTRVVLLDHRFELDDHHDFRGRSEGRVVRIDHAMTPESNLHIQTVAIAHARAFVGTYGGLAYLPPFLGVPAIGFSSAPEHTHIWHLSLAQQVFSRPPWGSLAVMRPSEAELVAMAAPEPFHSGGSWPASALDERLS